MAFQRVHKAAKDITDLAGIARVHASGTMTISDETWQRLGEPDAVFLYHDPDAKALGLHPAKKGQGGAYVIREYGTKMKARTVTIRRLAKQAGIRPGNYRIDWHDDEPRARICYGEAE